MSLHPKNVNVVESGKTLLTCREVAASVGHGLFAIEHGVGLDLVGRTWCQISEYMLKLIVLNGDGLIGGKIVRQTEDFQLEGRIVALRWWTPVDDGILARPYRNRQVGRWIWRRSYRHRPREPVMVCRVGVVQPEVVPRSGEAVGELNLVTDVPRCDRCIRGWIANRWVVIKTVVRAILAEVAGNFYHKVGTSTNLQWKKREKKNRFEYYGY